MAITNERRIIYDFGANNGDNLPYYLTKADLVVAVEANPALVAQIQARFSAELEAGRLIIVNRVLAEQTTSQPVPFYVHKTSHVLSQLPQPAPEEIANFTPVMVPTQRASEIVNAYGNPYYIKIDIEFIDQMILEDLFAAGIRPPYISAESHDAGIFASLVSRGGYRAFKLVDGMTVVKKFADWPITTSRGVERYSFPNHSAGPFGEDIPGPWICADKMFYLLGRERLGWRDLHATNCAAPDLSYQLPLRRDLTLREIIKCFPSAVWRVIQIRLDRVRKRFANR